MTKKPYEANLLLACVIIPVAMPTAINAAQSAAQTVCATAAFEEYNRANTTLLMQAVPVMTPESIVTQRRLEEQYCLRYARCIIGDPANSSLRVPYAASFSSCLRNESLEKYK